MSKYQNHTPAKRYTQYIPFVGTVEFVTATDYDTLYSLVERMAVALRNVRAAHFWNGELNALITEWEELNTETHQ